MKIKLFYKFAAVMIFLAVAPLAVAGYRSLKINRNALEGLTKHNHITTAVFLARGIDDYIESLGEKLLFLVSTQALDDIDYSGKQALVRSLLSSSEDFITVSAVNSRGEEFIKTYHPDYTPEAQILSHAGTELLEKARTGEPALSDTYRKQGQPRIDIMYPSGREFIFITLDLSELFSRVAEAGTGPGSSVFLVDGEGFVLTHPEEKMTGKKLQVPPVIAVLERASVGSMEYETGEEKFVGAYAPAHSMGWGVVTSQPAQYAYAAAIRARRGALKWMLASAILAAAAAFFLAGGLSGPVFKLAAAAGKVAEGKFDSEVNIKTGDELQTLAEDFNNMVRALRKYNEMQIDKIIAEQTKTKAIVFSIGDGIILTDYRGKLMLVNSRARELLEIEREPAEGEHILNYIKSSKLKKIFNGETETEIDLSDEKRRKVIKAFSDEVRTSSGKKLGKMKVVRDITLEKEIEEMKESFLHSVTHDLKSPLSAIKGMTALLKVKREDGLSGEEKKYFSVLNQETERLMGMINDILNLAKLETGKLQPERKKFDLSQMLFEIRDTFLPNAQDDSIRLETETPDHLKLKADPNLLRRVIINLLSNALKYTPTGGTVTLKAVRVPEGIFCSVKDTGEGMPPEMCEKIFDRFQQIDGRSKGGTGIGLNVSKEIVQAHGGRIWAESEPGMGSEVKFILPENGS